MVIKGTKHDDDFSLAGTTGDDVFAMKKGGDDIVFGNDGNDGNKYRPTVSYSRDNRLGGLRHGVLCRHVRR